MQQLSGLDSVFMLGELPAVPMHISALSIYNPATAPDQSLSFDDLKAQMADEVLRQIPLLKCRIDEVPLTLDEPYWVEDAHFNLDFHLHRIALPAPADWQELHRLCSRLHGEPLDRSRPLWEAWFIEGLDNLDGLPQGCVGVFIKVHHALMDGKTAMRLYTSMHSHDPAQPATPAPAEQMPAYTQPGLVRKLARAYRHNVIKPLKLSQALGRALPLENLKPWQSRATVEEPVVEKRRDQAPTSLFNTEITANRTVGHIRLPLARLRDLSEVSSATINDIALAIVGGALRSYLRSRQALPGNTLVSGMPIDIRRGQDLETTGNMISFANVPLYTDESDAAARLRSISSGARQSKKGNKAIGPKTMVKVLDNVYPGLLIPLGKWLINSGLIYEINPYVNTVVSNVPGVNKPCYLRGAKLVDYMGFGPLAPTMGLFHVVASTHDTLSLSFTSCPTMMPDAQAYQQALADSWQELQEAFGL